MTSAWLAPAPLGHWGSCRGLRTQSCVRTRCASAVSMNVAVPSRACNGFDVARFFECLLEAQTSICGMLESLEDGSRFRSDPWIRAPNGSGVTRVLQDGALFEKAGVNISHVHGRLTQERAQAMQTRGRKCEAGSEFQAAALSFVLHAHSPFIPTLRGDIRVFATGNPGSSQYWGGGGVDLTPVYINEPQIRDFHCHWKRVCDKVDTSYYHQFKKQCDDYFYLPARGEWRGVGGLFFDDLALQSEALTRFLITLSSEFIPSYLPIVAQNRDVPWTGDQKKFQRIRRGRYIGEVPGQLLLPLCALLAPTFDPRCTSHCNTADILCFAFVTSSRIQSTLRPRGKVWAGGSFPNGFHLDISPAQRRLGLRLQTSREFTRRAHFATIIQSTKGLVLLERQCTRSGCIKSKVQHSSNASSRGTCRWEASSLSRLGGNRQEIP
jgi:coproporphyrinogen III oxidase